MKPAATDYLAIEATLQTRLLKAWRPVSAALYKKMLPLLADKKYDDALALAKSIDLGPIATKNREYIKAVLWKAAEFGAKQAAQSHKTAMAVGTYTTLLDKVADLFIASFVHNATEQVYDSALQSIARLENADVVQKADSKTRYVREFVSFQGEGDDMVKVISSLHTSRLAVWGFAAEAEVRGIQKYKLSAVLDHRTSAFCRFINGKVFEVSDLRGRINQTLQATDPDDLKTLAPWPNQSKASIADYTEMSSYDLAAKGFSVPPFHPGCRTICQLVESTTQVENVTLTPIEVQPGFTKATEDSFYEARIPATPEQVDHWNKVFSVSPVDALAQLTNRSALDVLTAKDKKAIKFTPEGDISLKGRTAFAEGQADMNIVFDPFREQVFLNYAEFKNAPALDASEYLRNLYRKTVDLSKPAGMKSFVVSASGDMGAFAHAKMGFVPTSDEWAVLATEIKAGLSDLKLSDVQEKLVSAILDSKNPKAIWTLAELNTKVGGQPLGKLLLEDKSYQAILNLDDADAMERLGWYL